MARKTVRDEAFEVERLQRLSQQRSYAAQLEEQIRENQAKSEAARARKKAEQEEERRMLLASDPGRKRSHPELVATLSPKKPSRDIEQEAVSSFNKPCDRHRDVSLSSSLLQSYTRTRDPDLSSLPASLPTIFDNFHQDEYIISLKNRTKQSIEAIAQLTTEIEGMWKEQGVVANQVDKHSKSRWTTSPQKPPPSKIRQPYKTDREDVSPLRDTLSSPSTNKSLSNKTSIHASHESRNQRRKRSTKKVTDSNASISTLVNEKEEIVNIRSELRQESTMVLVAAANLESTDTPPCLRNSSEFIAC